MIELDKILIYFFILLNLFTILGLFFTKKESKFNDKKFYKFCPCHKLAQNGILSNICAYSAMGGFLYSGLSMSFIGFTLQLILIFFLSLFSAYLSWSLKSE